VRAHPRRLAAQLAVDADEGAAQRRDAEPRDGLVDSFEVEVVRLQDGDAPRERS
jgi:hypothetical protein